MEEKDQTRRQARRRVSFVLLAVAVVLAAGLGWVIPAFVVFAVGVFVAPNDSFRGHLADRTTTSWERPG